MNNATPALLAFLLVLSLPAMPVVAASPDGGNSRESDMSLQRSPAVQTAPTEIENTTNRLRLTGDVTSEYKSYSPDLGVALASADDELRIDQEQYTIVDDEFETATTEEREILIQTAYERLMDRADTLEQREREAVADHASGDRSTDELLQTLLRNHNEAAKLSETLEELDARAAHVPGYSLTTKRADEKIFDVHRTPVRKNLEQVSETAADDSHDVVVSTSQNGYSLSMMEGSRYIIETTRFDNRNKTAPNQFEDREAYDRTLELYPWADEHGNPHFQDNSPDHYWTEISHDHGRLEVYLDGGAGDIYREVQELSSPSLPSNDHGPWSNNSVNMTVNKTLPNGPIKVTTTDVETDEPETATITIDGFELGETDEDGTIWVNRPVGTHELKAETANGTVEAIITE